MCATALSLAFLQFVLNCHRALDVGEDVVSACELAETLEREPAIAREHSQQCACLNKQPD